jgi:hypothetical protein
VRGRTHHVDLHRLERLVQDLAEPVEGVPEVVEVAMPVEGSQDRPSLRRVSFGDPQDGAADSTPSGVRTLATFPIATALFGWGPRRQWTTKLSAAESNGPSTGSGFITSASTVIGCSAASRWDERASTFGFGSSRVTSVPAGGAAFSMKYPVPGPTSRCLRPRCRR